MKETSTDEKYHEYTLSFKCTERKKCLAWKRFKANVPWIAYEILSDGTVVATGATIKTLQYGKYLRKQIRRSCILCMKIKQQKHK